MGEENQKLFPFNILLSKPLYFISLVPVKKVSVINFGLIQGF